MFHFCSLVEEAGFKSTMDLFAKNGDEKRLDNFIPKTERDFAKYAELISHEIRPYEVHGSHHICSMSVAAIHIAT